MSWPQNLRFPSRVAFENTYLPSLGPMSGSPNGSIRRGGLRVIPNGAPTSARRDTRPGRVEREGDGPERAHRVGDHVDGRKLGPHPRCRAGTCARARADRRRGSRKDRRGAVTRPVDREHAVGLRERPEDRDDLEGAAEPAVDVQERRPRAELDDLCLALRPANPADARVRCEPGEQRCLRLRELSVQLCLHAGEDRCEGRTQHRLEYLSGYGFAELLAQRVRGHLGSVP